MSVRDDAGREAEERFVDVVAAFPSDTQAFHAVIPGDSPLDHPSDLAKAGAMRLTAAGDAGADALGVYDFAVLVVIVGAVSVQLVRSTAWPPATAPYRRDLADQGQQ